MATKEMESEVGKADMSDTLLVKLLNYGMLYVVKTRMFCPFKVWVRKDGKDRACLYWTGREVEKVYSNVSDECWYSVPIPEAIKTLLDKGAAISVDTEPYIESGLPE